MHTEIAQIWTVQKRPSHSYNLSYQVVILTELSLVLPEADVVTSSVADVGRGPPVATSLLPIICLSSGDRNCDAAPVDAVLASVSAVVVRVDNVVSSEDDSSRFSPSPNEPTGLDSFSDCTPTKNTHTFNGPLSCST